MSISKYIVLFAICSVFGWVFESVFAIVTQRKWERRGFLYGPLCPIYGFGVVAIVLIVKAAVNQLGMTLEWYGVFAVAFFGSMVLEYVVSWGLERLFNAYWWDYSNMPLNINGRTCVPAALLFGAGGLLAVYVISPYWDMVASAVPFVAMEVAAYAIVILITVDSTLTVSALTQFQKRVDAMDKMLNERASEATERLVSFKPAPLEHVKQGGERIKQGGELIKQGGERLRQQGSERLRQGGERVRAEGERVAEESERLREQAIRQVADTFGSAQRAALMRVKGFRRKNLSSFLETLKGLRK